uniref:C2 domain-containing protein n=1 Tax=Strongyloides stercoralis TaxID=6248 RepID=A0A0K0EGC0_STRER
MLILNEKNESPLWIVAKVKNIEWRRSCLSTERCAEPRFQLITSLLNEFEMHRIDSPVNVESILIREIVLNVFFENAHPENVLLKGYVVGLDPLYKIPNECDKSNEVLVFKSQSQQNNSFLQSTVTVELQGRCFNAYVEITKYQNICPWCLDTSLKIEDRTEMLSKNSSIVSFNHIPLTTEMLIFLGIVVLIMTTGCSQNHFPTHCTNTSQTINTLTKKSLGIPIESTYETIDACENGINKVEPNNNDEYLKYWVNNNVNRTFYPTFHKLEFSRNSELFNSGPKIYDPKKFNTIRTIPEIQNSFI